MERRLLVLAASAFVVAAVLGSAWVTGQFTTPAVDRTDGYVSELAALDQPWTRLFRVSDALSGLACVFGVALVPRVAGEWPGWLALAAFGLLTIAAGLFPLDCAALSDPACGRAGTTFGHRAHMLAGPLGTVAVLVAMVVLSLRWRSWVSWLFTWLSLAATALVVAAHADRHGVGLAHRAQLTLIAVWLVYAAVHLLISDDDHAQTVRDRPYAPAAGWTADPAAGTPGGLDPLERDSGSAARSDGYGRQHVVEQGTGPAVLVTAGAGGAWFHWDPVAARLAGCRRVIRFDRPGLGLSPRSHAPPTLYAEVARLAALSPAHPEQVTVLAHGMACWHAEAFARLHPLRVAGLVMVDPACAVRRRRLALSGSAGRWLPALGGTWGATALARLAGPAAHRLLAGGPDPSGAYSMGKVPLAVAGEWLARRDMAADLRRLREDKPFPGVPVIVISTGARDSCRRRLAAMLGARLVRVRVSRRQVTLRAPDVIAEAVAVMPANGPGPFPPGRGNA